MTFNPISVLLVSSREPPGRLVCLLEQNAAVTRAAGRQEAIRALAEDQRIQAVVTDEVLADGTWRAVVADALQANAQMQVVVYTGPWPEMDLYREARALGARSLLVEPYDRHQIECLLQGVEPIGANPAPKPKAPASSMAPFNRRSTAILLVSAGFELDGIARTFRSHGLDVHRATDRGQAQGLLATGKFLEFVFTTEILPDATWRDVLSDVRERCARAHVFIASDSGKGPVLMLEAISQGAVLVRLQDHKQVQWVIELAVARCRWRAFRAGEPRARPFRAAG